MRFSIRAASPAREAGKITLHERPLREQGPHHRCYDSGTKLQTRKTGYMRMIVFL